MPSRAEIVTFDDSPPPPGADPWVSDVSPAVGIEFPDPDPAWLRGNPGDRDRYAAAKLQAASEANAGDVPRRAA